MHNQIRNRKQRNQTKKICNQQKYSQKLYIHISENISPLVLVNIDNNTRVTSDRMKFQLRQIECVTAKINFFIFTEMVILFTNSESFKR